jgi:cell division protein FtsI/penicillin-binding protein 2
MLVLLPGAYLAGWLREQLAEPVFVVSISCVIVGSVIAAFGQVGYLAVTGGSMTWQLIILRLILPLAVVNGLLGALLLPALTAIVEAPEREPTAFLRRTLLGLEAVTKRVRRRRLVKRHSCVSGLRAWLRGVPAFGALTIQLWQMQVVHGDQYRDQAELNRLRVRTISPPRGVILDRNGRSLVNNVPSFSVALVAADLPADQDKEALVLSRLARILNVGLDEIAGVLAQMRGEQRLFEPVKLMDGVGREQALLLEERQSEMPGVVVRADAQRFYPDGPLVSHLVGYMGRITSEQYAELRASGYLLNDRLGQTGIEASYEEVLRGVPGSEVTEVNAYGRAMRTLASRPAASGANVVLSVDLGLQKVMTEALREGMGQSKWAVAIAVAPKTGEVLGMVAHPSYDNNVFSSGASSDQVTELLNDPQHLPLNYAIGATAPPGSTFKVVVGSAALGTRGDPGTTITAPANTDWDFRLPRLGCSRSAQFLSRDLAVI